VALVNMTEWIVSAESLKIGDLVGAGAFAQVYRAHLHGQEVARRQSTITFSHH
jgi:predicted unusual protein kinase regulating ubiquinone biosynthesis (AarF/ABC1/UbiB family)